MLTTTELYSQSGTNVARDFVEAPSQIFENWAWDYDVLKNFSRHYETGEVLPKLLFDKMLAAKKVGSGMSATGQVFLGTYDLTLHDQFDPNSGKTTTDVLRSVQNEVLPYPYIEGTYFQSAFGHLDGYGSSYYGYLWSLVYAQDMFSVFSKNGILDKTTGLRYRDIILARGSSEKAINLVKEDE
jgi:thimet oligopeptidase